MTSTRIIRKSIFLNKCVSDWIWNRIPGRSKLNTINESFFLSSVKLANFIINWSIILSVLSLAARFYFSIFGRIFSLSKIQRAFSRRESALDKTYNRIVKREYLSIAFTSVGNVSASWFHVGIAGAASNLSTCSPFPRNSLREYNGTKDARSYYRDQWKICAERDNGIKCFCGECSPHELLTWRSRASYAHGLA